MEERFNYLLHRYVQRQATNEEREELKALIRDNHYEEIIKDDLTSFLLKRPETPEDMSNDNVDPEELYQRILTNIDRQPITSVRSAWPWLRIAAMVIVGLGLGWGLYLTSNRLAGTTTEETQEHLMVRYTSKDFIRLPDGSTVVLNEGSELTYSIPYGNGQREVTLTGEAYFDIKPNPDNPFIVHTGQVQTKVLGTAFNVNARKEKVVVTVTRGLVEVGDAKKTYSLVRPDEQIVVNTASNIFEKTTIKGGAGLEWQAQNLVFDGISLADAAKIMEEHFDITVTIENAAIQKCRISAWFLNGESLEEVLEMVCGIRQADYRLNEGQVTITGGISCKEQP